MSVTNTALSSSNVLNTSATISYTLSNTIGSTQTSYLYRFPGTVAPSILNGGTFIVSVVTNAGSPSVPTVVSGSNTNTGLSKDTTYVYAFYTGQASGSSTILKNAGVDAFTTFTTANLLNTSLTLNAIASTSATIGYALTTNSVNRTVYLYRFTASTAPSTLNTSTGTLIGGAISVTSSGVTSTTTNTGLTLFTTYTYAFYNGNTNGTSTILTSNGISPVSLTVYTTSDAYNTSISPSGITSSQATINFTLVNYTNAGVTSYLYRFSGKVTPPNKLNSGGSTQLLTVSGITTSAASGGVPVTTTSSFIDSGLNINTNYTYAFYNGTQNGQSDILKNPSGTVTYTTVYISTNPYVNSITSSNLTNTFNTVNYTVVNNQATSQAFYLYRFLGTTAPSTLSLTNSSLVTNFTVASNGSSTNSIFNGSLLLNTNYTYAFYNGNTAGTSSIINDSANSLIVLTISTTNVFNPSLIASDISTGGATINYTINNSPSSSAITVYLYRFTGLSAPTTLTTTGIYSNATQLTSFNVNGGSSVVYSYADNSLSANINYTYAFYNGNIVGTNTILQDNSSTLNPVSVTLNTYYAIISSLSSSSTTNTSTNVNYSITNNLTNPGSVYLFRFDGSINAPSPLNTSLTGATQVTIIPLTSDSTLASFYNDTTLSSNQQYTYAIYNGNSSGTSTVLTDLSNASVQTVVTTTNNFSAPTTYNISKTTTKNSAVNITLVGTDPQSSTLTYTYTNPTNGTISGTSPNLVYTPSADYIGSDSFTYYATNTYSLSSSSSTVSILVNDPDASVPCFKEGTKILCFNKEEKKEEYLPIERIRKGTLVKTIYNGYVKVDMIGRSTIFNSGDSERTANRLYVCKKQNYSKLFEDLVITGYHSILVGDFKNLEQREKTIDLLGEIYITDNKYRLPACIDDNATPYENRGRFIIWHLALENRNYYANYGIYANGLLVESCSKRYLKELSGMELID